MHFLYHSILVRRFQFTSLLHAKMDCEEKNSYPECFQIIKELNLNKTTKCTKRGFE